PAPAQPVGYYPARLGPHRQRVERHPVGARALGRACGEVDRAQAAAPVVSQRLQDECRAEAIEHTGLDDDRRAMQPRAIVEPPMAPIVIARPDLSEETDRTAAPLPVAGLDGLDEVRVVPQVRRETVERGCAYPEILAHEAAFVRLDDRTQACQHGAVVQAGQ